MSEQPNILNFEIKSFFFFIIHLFIFGWLFVIFQLYYKKEMKQNVNKARQTDNIRKMERYCTNERTYTNNRKKLN